MSAIQDLLQRWGFVRLRSYGLELTPDGRILSSRPAVLDDGSGGRVVGWRDGDVSIWKLSRWSEAPAAVLPNATVPAPTPLAVQPPAALVPNLAISLTSAAVAAPPAASATVMQADVAAGPTVDEDDWEWTIALARARVAVDEPEPAVPPPPPEPRLTRQLSAPPAQLAVRSTSRPHTVKDPGTSAEWPKTEPIGAIDYEDYSRAARTPGAARRTAAPMPPPAPQAPVPPVVAIPRNTVIPVPVLPTVDTASRGRFEPVVRPSPVRLAKGTQPVEHSDPRRRPAAAIVVDDPFGDLAVGENTRPGVAVSQPRAATQPPATLPPAPAPIGDRTKPGIALPKVVRAGEPRGNKPRSAPR